MELQFKCRSFKVLIKFLCFSLHWLPFVIILLNVESYVKSAGCLCYAQMEHNIILLYQDVFFPVGYLSYIQSLINVVNSTHIEKYLIKNDESQNNLPI